MKKHMQTKHGQNKVLNVVQQQITTTSPRRIGFIHLSKEIPNNTEQNNKDSSIDDEEQLMVDNSNRDEAVEVTIDEVEGEIGPERALNNWQCGECGQFFDVENDLKEHIEKSHVSKSNQCEENAMEKQLETLQEDMNS